MLVTADAGATWKPQPSGVKEHLMDITFQGESGWVAGFQGTILHSADAGKTWARQTSGTTQTLEAISFLDADHGWAVGWAGAILRTADGGKTWQTVKTPAASWSLTSVYFKNPNEGWVSGFAGQILHTRDGGATWEAQTSPVHGWLTNVSMDRSNRLWITYDDGFLMSEDSGAHWKGVLTPQRYFLGRLIASGGSLWALGQSVLLRQTGNGTEWKKIDSLVPDSTSRLLSAPPTADSTQSKPTS
jgi:photosystem II stability/assembly factor-like uncharacterized protein